MRAYLLLEQAIELAPQREEFYQGRAAASLALGRSVQAIKDTTTALLLGSSSKNDKRNELNCLYMRATAKFKLGELQGAFVDASQADTVAAGDPVQEQQAKLLRSDIVAALVEQKRQSKSQTASEAKDHYANAALQEEVSPVDLVTEDKLALKIKEVELEAHDTAVQAQKKAVEIITEYMEAVRMHKQGCFVPTGRISIPIQEQGDLDADDDAVISSVWSEEEEEEEEKEQDNDVSTSTVESCEVLRDRGNSQYNAGDYVAALRCYSDALQLNAECKLCHSNAAAALLKLERWEEARDAADAALQIDSSFHKAMCRRAQALKRLHEEKPLMAGNVLFS